MNKIITDSDIRWNKMLVTWIVPIWVVLALSMIGGGSWLVIIVEDYFGWFLVGLGIIFGIFMLLHIIARKKCGSWGFKVRVDIEELDIHYEADNGEAMESLIKQKFGSLEKFDEKLEALFGRR